MLGRRPDPGLFASANLLDLDQLSGTIYGYLAENGRQAFTDYQFRAIYSKRGRPSASPALMALACLLQHHESISDDMVIERLKFDLRWKAALDLDPFSFTPPFSKAPYVQWRARLVLHSKEGVAFEASVRRAVREGLLPKSMRVALDSSPVRGRGAVKDTFNLLSDAIRKTVRDMARESGEEPEELAAKIGAERHFKAASVKGSEVVDWSSPEAVGTFLKGLLEDGERVVAEAGRRGCAEEGVELLRQIVTQDVEEEGDQPKIRQGVAKGRTVSVSDPEQRHGHKSSGKSYTGHKVHVAVETQTEIVLAVEVTEPGTSDGSMTGQLIREVRRNSGREISCALGDCAYGTQPSVEQATRHEVELKTKMPRLGKKGKFGPSDFKVAEDRKSAVCPAGQRSYDGHRPRKRGILLAWPKETCQSCPLEDRCFKNKRGHRQLLVRDNHHERRQREAWARSPEGRAVLRERTAVEHAIGRAKNKGAGRSRYFGRVKTRFQWLWTTALTNLLQIVSLKERESARMAVA